MRRRSVVLWLVPLVTLAALAIFTLQRRVAQQLPPPPSWPTQAWQTTTPEAQGIDSSRLASALLTMRQKQVNIHSLLIIRNGYVVVDATFYPYDGAALHDVASVTKSITTTLIGIAADQGKLKLDQPVVSFLRMRFAQDRVVVDVRETAHEVGARFEGLLQHPVKD